MRPERNIKEQIKRLRRPVDAGTHDKTLAHLLAKLQQRKNQQAAGLQPNLGRIIMTRPLGKLAVAAVAIVAASIALSQLGDLLGGTTVAWADITEHFESVPFFSVTIYLGHDTSAEAKKIEIWKSEDSLIRAQEGDKVIFARAVEGAAGALDFGNADQQVVAFDRSTRQPVEADGVARIFLRLLCSQGRFSLNTLLEDGSDDVSISAVETGDTAASEETVVFDGQHKSTPERVRIWALRRSKLPVRVRFEDPRNGECADFLFNYMEKKDAAFFDANAFARGQR